MPSPFTPALSTPQGMPDQGQASPPQQPIGQPSEAPASPPPVHPDLQRPPIPAGSQAVSVDELAQLRLAQQRLAEIEELAQQQEIEEQQARYNKLMHEDPAKALSEQRTWWENRANELAAQKQDLEQRWLSEKTEFAISSALAGIPIQGDTPEERAEAAADLRELLRKDFHAVRNGLGEIEVRERVSGRPASEVLRERLSGKRYARYFAPTSRGGSGTDGTRPLANVQQPVQLSEFQQKQLAYMQARQDANAGQPFGLRGAIPPTR